MGAGKTYWGKLWANNYKYSFIDLDETIALKENESVASIFEKKGEEYFRKTESKILRKIIQQNTIIACGGGTACYNDNMRWMNENGTTIYLCRSIDELYNNLEEEKNERPLLRNVKENELYSFIEQKLNERSFFYNQSQLILKTEAMNINALDKILKKHA